VTLRVGRQLLRLPCTRVAPHVTHASHMAALHNDSQVKAQGTGAHRTAEQGRTEHGDCMISRRGCSEQVRTFSTTRVPESLPRFTRLRRGHVVTCQGHSRRAMQSRAILTPVEPYGGTLTVRVGQVFWQLQLSTGCAQRWLRWGAQAVGGTQRRGGQKRHPQSHPGWLSAASRSSPAQRSAEPLPRSAPRLLCS